MRESLGLLRGGVDVVRRKPLPFIMLPLVVLGLAALLYPSDASLLKQIAGQKSGPVFEWARGFSTWGDFGPGSVLLAVLIWLAGAAFRKTRWQMAAVACLLAAMLAGLTANVFRFGVGRPRPKAEADSGFRAGSFKDDYHSFPSAHASTSFGTATALLVAAPEIGVPVLVGAGAVGWSRMYLKRHYPTDVLVGASVGGWFGLALGMAVRRRLTAADGSARK